MAHDAALEGDDVLEPLPEHDRAKEVDLDCLMCIVGFWFLLFVINIVVL